MSNVSRLNDICEDGDTIISVNATKTFINGKLVACLGDITEYVHSGTGTIIESSKTVFVEGNGVARIGDLTSCGSRIATGSENVFSN